MNRHSHNVKVQKYLARKRSEIETPRDWFRMYRHMLKGKAKQKGQEWSITEDDLEFPTHCPVFGFKLEPLSTDKNIRPSIDRHDSSKGYIPGNVAIMSFKANRLKNNMTIDDCEALFNYFVSKKLDNVPET